MLINKKSRQTRNSRYSRKFSIIGANILVFSMLAGITIFSFTSPFGAKVAEAQDFARFRVPEICNNKECGWQELMALANEILKFAVYLAVLGATVSFVYAGFKMMMNQGNSGEIEKAKGIIYTAAIGLVITMSAWLIVDFVLDNFGVRPEFRSLVQ